MDTANSNTQARLHVARMRQKKRDAAAAIGIDDDAVSRVVEAFYGKIRADELLGPIFIEKISDWPTHLGRMKMFWRSVLFNSGEFSGNPMVKHQAMPQLTSGHFSHWLDLFYATLREECSDSAAVELFGERARMIADSLLTGISIRREGIAAANSGKDLPHV